MVEFPNYADDYYDPSRFSQIAKMGRVITDDMLLKVFMRIDPPLLEPQQHEYVTAILERRHGRRARNGVPSPSWLAKKITAIDRPDVDPSYLDALAARLRTGKGTTQLELAREFEHNRWKHDRLWLVEELFRRFREKLNDKPDRVIDPDFGEIKVPVGMPPQMQAAEMTLEVYSQKLGFPWMSHRKLIRLASMRQYIK